VTRTTDPMKTAIHLALKHGLGVASVTEKGRPAWVVYRRNPHGRDVRVGRRTSPTTLLRLVKDAAGITDQPQPKKEEAF
jgi:hypothetical protein